jgi:hypothetical protein
MLTNILVFVVGALFLVLSINVLTNEKRVIEACSNGDEDACFSLDTGF